MWNERVKNDIYKICLFVCLKYCLDLVFRLGQRPIDPAVGQLITSTPQLLILGDVSHPGACMQLP